MIPVNESLLDGKEEKYLREGIESGWISSEGPFVNRFEKKLSKAVGRRNGIAVSSCTAALGICCSVLNLEPGDEVILPSFTIISCAQSNVLAGGKPVVVDSDPETWNMGADKIEAKITPQNQSYHGCAYLRPSC